MKVQVKLLVVLAAVIATALLFEILFVAIPAAVSLFSASVAQSWFDSLTPADSMKVNLIGKFMAYAVPAMVPGLAAVLIARRRAKQANAKAPDGLRDQSRTRTRIATGAAVQVDSLQA